MKTKKASLFIIICAVSIMAGVFMGSGTGLLSGESYTLAQLRGAVDCNCNDCNDDSIVFNECWHLNPSSGTLENHLDPNGTPPVPPGPNQPNPHDNPSQYRACSPDYCIKNTIFFAECPEDPNGAACPTRTDPDKPWVTQEIKTGAPSECNDPNYTVVDAFSPTDCKIYGSTNPPRGACEVSSCEGETLSHTWDHDNDPNTAEQVWYDPNRPGRTVCDV